MMAMRMGGKVALVTGGGSGIGRAVCRRFAEEGARVIVADIDEEAAAVTAAPLAGATARRIDVTMEAEWIAAVAAAIEDHGRLDVVANIAGIGIGGSIEDFDLAGWRKMVDVNLTGVMLGCKHGIAGIVRSGGSGAIVNMSSIAGIAPPPDVPGYAATKGGVTTLTRSVALHCAARGYPIRCVSIHPTYVDTEMLDPVAAASGKGRAELVAHMARQVPVGRVATPIDVANAILFAASDEAAMISGSAILVDGAQLAGPAPAHFA